MARERDERRKQLWIGGARASALPSVCPSRSLEPVLGLPNQRPGWGAKGWAAPGRRHVRRARERARVPPAPRPKKKRARLSAPRRLRGGGGAPLLLFNSPPAGRSSRPGPPGSGRNPRTGSWRGAGGGEGHVRGLKKKKTGAAPRGARTRPPRRGVQGARAGWWRAGGVGPPAFF